ncbi:zinc-binding dehydrogenase [Planosporangium thailandense]|uniref:Zinc-binding dehydrogenase n=2 Tax=Planosporangium thailandense TaxID=765197 RepID=A0ABX0Y4D6_9ACTN|nr:zinc-binding dehydrogenase [Planosporangium thailandense]
MRALIVDPDVPSALRLGEVPEPEPGPGQVVIDVACTSLNWGELNLARSGDAPPGTVLGWDAAGVVTQGAADGTGPAVGTRVVTRGPDGGWAERRAADVSELAAVPDGVDLADAAALPVAGVTALRALRAAGPILGRRVLVTSAAGGVGRFAVQLASLGGAYVIASVGSPERGMGLIELGADDVVVGVEELEDPVDVVVDNVGGRQLVDAFAALAPGGNLQSVGWTSGEPAVFPPYSTVGPARTLTSFTLGPAIADDLATLLDLVADGLLKVEIGWRGPWDRVADAAETLLARRVGGKAVLDVTTVG